MSTSGWRRSHGAARSTLGRRQTQSGGAESANEFPALDVLGTGGQQLVSVLLGDVVVISLEAASRNLVAVGELVQLVV